MLVTPKVTSAEIATLKKKLEGEGVVVEIVAPGLGDLGDKALKSTPSVVYDGVIVLAAKKDYEDPEDVGNALKFIAQAFKHCKAIGGNLEGKTLTSTATQGLSDEDMPGVTFANGKGNSETWLKAFLKSLGKHRHWDRADLVKELPA